ncbi:MAG: hypothetical protein AAGI88_24280 [Pseudomonadota bacterium]
MHRRASLVFYLVVVLGLVLLIHQTAPLIPGEERIVLDLNDAQAVVGRKATTKDGVAFLSNAKGAAALRIQASVSDVSGHPFLRLDFAALPVTGRLLVFFRVNGKESENPAFTLSLSDVDGAFVSLDEVEAWQGQLESLVVAVESMPGARTVLKNVSLEPDDIRSVYRNTLWSWRSIAIGLTSNNSVDSKYLSYTRVNASLSVAVFTLVAVCLASLAYIGIGSSPKRWHIVATAALAGTFVLDTRWLDAQWNSVVSTAEKFSGKPEEERVVSNEHGGLFTVAEQINNYFSRIPPRRVIVSSSVPLYEQRTAYYLLPNNTYWDVRVDLPEPETLVAGDHIVLVSPSSVRVSPDGTRLTYPAPANTTLRVVTRLSLPNALLLEVL